LRKFYGKQPAPVWIDDGNLLPRAKYLRSALVNADAEGLSPGAYRVDEISKFWGGSSTGELVRQELLLTNAFLRYGAHVRFGRSEPEDTDSNWHIESSETDPVKLLKTTLASEDFQQALLDLPPPHTGYRSLRKQLAHYRRIADKGGWPVLPDGPAFGPGDYHAHIRLLRHRLIAEMDIKLPLNVQAENYDQEVIKVVKKFQAQHGLKADGILGKKTRDALNVPASFRADQISLNMERWRWMPRMLGDRYIMVNIANFQMTIMEQGQVKFRMRVITGKPERPTPVIKGKLTHAVFNPFWNIPQTIAVEDMLPKQQRDPDFFKSQQIRVYKGWDEKSPELDPAEIDWHKLDENNFPYRLRQDPGPRNALGRIKFLFSNPFDIYLHDTASPGLFQARDRDFSSGCIRVHEPLRLASYLMGEKTWPVSRVKEIVAAGETRKVALATAVPIYLAYWTAWVNEKNTLNFRQDVYQQDSKLLECH
jgi:murein L,D-transpeptidase YcbB/YkuD